MKCIVFDGGIWYNINGVITLKFSNKNDAYNYMLKIKTESINQAIRDYNSIVRIIEDMYKKQSVMKLVTDVVGELKHQKHEHFQIQIKWIACGRKLFGYSSYGLEDIVYDTTRYALMYIICKELEKANIIYYVTSNLILRVNGDKEYWLSQKINGDFGEWDWHIIGIMDYCDVYLKNHIPGSSFIKERLEIKKKYCSVTELKKVYPSSIDTYKKEKSLAVYNKGIFTLGGGYILNCCSLDYRWFGSAEITLQRIDMAKKPLEKWV